MIRILVFGASIAYGVGGEDGGWADKIKNYYHHQMYSHKGKGEKIEVHTFAKSGAIVELALNNCEAFINAFSNETSRDKTISLVSIGLNNSKAVNSPDNFVSTIKQYKMLKTQLLDKLQNLSDEVIAVGFTAVDESKVAPKTNPLNGSSSFFFNSRIELFNKTFEKLCKERSITFVMPAVPSVKWVNSHLYKDGLHPNDEGHEAIFQALKPLLPIL